MRLQVQVVGLAVLVGVMVDEREVEPDVQRKGIVRGPEAQVVPVVGMVVEGGIPPLVNLPQVGKFA